MISIHQCIQKISHGNHFSYVQDGTYVRTYVRTDKGDAISPPPITNGGVIKTFERTGTWSLVKGSCRGEVVPPPVLNVPICNQKMQKEWQIEENLISSIQFEHIY